MGRVGRVRVTMLGLLVAGAATGWHYRDRLRALVPGAAQPVAVATAVVTGRPVPQDHPDVLYTWVDDKGVTHFEQQRGKDGSEAEAVAYDGSRITPMAPADPGQVERLRKAAGEPAAPVGGGSLHQLREEMAEGARAMKAQRDAQRDF